MPESNKKRKRRRRRRKRSEIKNKNGNLAICKKIKNKVVKKRERNALLLFLSSV